MAYKKEQIEIIFKTITERIVNGEAIRNILKDADMPSYETFYKWLEESKDKAKQYARACELRAEVIFDEMLEIADTTIDGVVIETDDNGRTKEKKGDMLGHRRLQVETRKWILSKLNPKKYSDKIQTEDVTPQQSKKIIVKIKRNEDT